MRLERGSKGRILRSFLCGGVAAGVIYVLMFGPATLNPTYVDWIYAGRAGGDGYLPQLSWEFFRVDDWRFPIGAMKNILYGVKDSGSIFYQALCPLPAIFFKLLRGVLPDQFQYVGIWQLFSFSLLGGLSSGILAKYVKSLTASVLLAQLFAFSPPMILRSFHHYVLCSQWVIVFPIFIRVYKDEIFYNTRRQLIAWVAAMSISMLIFPYFLVLVGVAMVGFLLEDWLENRKTGKVLLIFFSSMVGVFLCFWQIGGIGQADNAGSAGGFGKYSANILYPFDSQGFSSILPDLPSVDEYNEGLGYLGLSIIVLLICALALLAYRGALTDGWRRSIRKNRATYISAAFVMITTTFLALGPKVYLGSRLVMDYTWCTVYMKLMTPFRSCGRLIWLCMYIIMFFAVITVFKEVKKKTLSIVLAAVLVFGQFYDLQPLIRTEAAQAVAGVVYDDPYSKGIWADLSDKIDHVCRLNYNFWGYPGTLESYCARNHLTINNLYCPRNDNAANTKNIAENINAVMTGTLRDDTLYCIAESEAFTTAVMTGENVVELHVDGYYLYIHKNLWDQLDQDKYQDIYMENTGEYLEAREAYLAENPGT